MNQIINSSIFLTFFNTILLFGLLISINASLDYSLVCKKGYRLTSIRRVNSAFQKDIVGSLTIECQKIFLPKKNEIQCKTLENTPQCNGLPEGCTNSQWLAGFHAYSIENSTNVVLLDPICCSSPSIQIDSLSCASELLNTAKRPFEHRIRENDLIYRSMQCWHRYNSTNTIVDLVWKMEICQFTAIKTTPKTLTFVSSSENEEPMDDNAHQILNATQRAHLRSKNKDVDFRHAIAMASKTAVDSTKLFNDQFNAKHEEQTDEKNVAENDNNLAFPTEFLSHCPSCDCHCGIDKCANGHEPIRLIHKATHPHKCSCDCACKYECL